MVVEVLGTCCLNWVDCLFDDSMIDDCDELSI